MTRTRSRHRATARSRFSESSQNPPSAASDSVISTTALTATRPARRRSRTASPIRNPSTPSALRSEEHTSELQSRLHLVCRLLLEKKKSTRTTTRRSHFAASQTPKLAPRGLRNGPSAPSAYPQDQLSPTRTALPQTHGQLAIPTAP